MNPTFATKIVCAFEAPAEVMIRDLRELHALGGGGICSSCGPEVEWPCDTIRLLDGETLSSVVTNPAFNAPRPKTTASRPLRPTLL